MSEVPGAVKLRETERMVDARLEMGGSERLFNESRVVVLQIVESWSCTMVLVAQQHKCADYPCTVPCGG